MAEFDETLTEIFIIEAETTPVRLNVNGRVTVIYVGVEAAIAKGFLPALRDCAGLRFRIVGEPGEALPGEEPDDFDADAVIEGNIEEVKDRLDALTAPQLEAALRAENDREVARSGVTKAIEKAIAARN